MDELKELEKKQLGKYRKEGIKSATLWIFVFLFIIALHDNFKKNNQSEISATEIKTKLDSKNFDSYTETSKKFYNDDINYLCKTDKELCINQWFDRIVKVEFDVNFMHVHSTGFIYYSDENYIYIVSNSHSIRIGDGKNSLIHDITVYSDRFAFNEKPISACAFFKNFSDLSIIKIPNVTNVIFEKPIMAKNIVVDRKLFVFTFKDEKLYFKPVVTFVDNLRKDFFMNMKALHGMSGSPVLNNKFEFTGVLHSASNYGGIATYNIGFLENETIDDFISGDNYNSKFICRTNF